MKAGLKSLKRFNGKLIKHKHVFRTFEVDQRVQDGNAMLLHALRMVYGYIYVQLYSNYYPFIHSN